MKQGKGYQSFVKENAGHCKYYFPRKTRDDATDGHYQMVSTEIRLVIFFAAEDGKALYNQQKQSLVTAAMKLKDTCSLEGNHRQTWTEN